MKIEEEMFYVDMAKVGNTVSNSISLAMESAMNNGGLKEVLTVLLSGFGVGYSWGGVVLKF